jgi:2-oxoglutarate ferredoxin oxidoreductase subunit beta
MSTEPPLVPLSRKDFASDQEVRWCPGCADYSILAQVQKLLPGLGVPRENFVFVSGIGCSGRFTYYMNTYGVHGIHGRAIPIATGIKLANPELSVWVVSGDGDAFAIGGNHMLHGLRRNIGLKVLVFNNRIYGLTKGQCSPTSELGKKTKSTPQGSIDYPLDPIGVALGAGATFVARAMATDAQHLQEVLLRAAKHEGSAFVEIWQECVIFNPGAFDALGNSMARSDAQITLRNGLPLRFGKELDKGLRLTEQGKLEVVNVADVGEARLLVYDETSDTLPLLMSRLAAPGLPVPFGVFRAVERAPYEALVSDQIASSVRAHPATSVQTLLESGQTWVVDE